MPTDEPNKSVPPQLAIVTSFLDLWGVIEEVDLMVRSLNEHVWLAAAFIFTVPQYAVFDGDRKAASCELPGHAGDH